MKRGVTSEFFDITVVGSGLAGSVAALSAADEGRTFKRRAKILVLESAAEKERGGNSRYTSNPDLTTSGQLTKLAEVSSKGLADLNLWRTISEKTPGTLRWLRSRGLQVHLEPKTSMAEIRPKAGRPPGGIGVLETLLESVQRLGAEVWYNSTATRLLLNRQGSLEGVLVRAKDGGSIKVATHAVILACGGFQGNGQMMTKYIGPEANVIRPYGKSSSLDKGAGISMAIEIGAALSGQFDRFHAALIDPRDPAPSVMAFCHGILVDNSGRRCLDEGERIARVQHDAFAMPVFHLPGHRGYFVSDSKPQSIEGLARTISSAVAPVSAMSIEDLAGKVGLPRRELMKTVKRFNQAIQPGVFDPNRPDGKKTKGIRPPKSNWALAIDAPPFVCYPVECANVLTFGGIAVDSQARVLSTSGSPIPGVYAAGETVGLHYGTYIGGGSVLSAVVLGKIAGREAVNYLPESRTA